MNRLSQLVKFLLASPLAALLALSLLGSGCTPSVPDDNSCVEDSDCRGNYRCVDSFCEAPISCESNIDCPLGQVCSSLTRECVAISGSGDGDRDGDGDGDGGDGDGDGDGGDGPVDIVYDDDGKGLQISCMQDNRYCERGNAWVCADGVNYEEVDCEGRGCSDGFCVVCEPGQAACDLDRNMLVECSSDGASFTETQCTSGACNPETLSCEFHVCNADTTFCRGNSVYECASDNMSFEHVQDCAPDGLFCADGACVTECEKAVFDNSYIGCEYWPVVLYNPVDSAFHSEFAVVVANPHASKSANVKVYSPSGTVTAQSTVNPGQVATLKLPWNAMNSRKSSGDHVVTQSAKGKIAYRLTSDLPVTAYQFNPLASQKGSEYSHSNDASLLLPTHVYAPPGEESTYFVMSVAHQRMRSESSGIFGSESSNHDWAAQVAVVATEDNTQVTLRARGGVADGGGLAGTNPGGTLTFTLNKHEVMQLASRPHGNPVSKVVRDEDAIFERFKQTKYEYRDSDLTGSIITSSKPVAVYSGADCYFMPYDEWACDHIEEQLFPVENLGSSYVAARTKLPPGAKKDPGDIWRIVAAVNNTQLTFSPQVHSNVTLNAGEWVQIQSTQNFTVRSQGSTHPISVAQFMVGQGATDSSMGDPAMILSVPRTQYRDNYAFTTPTTIAKNYINVVRPPGAEVILNGTAITSGWTPLGDVEILTKEIPGGNHTITASAKIGVTVYGYDSYVSYGYPAGMDLTRNVGVSLPW